MNLLTAPNLVVHPRSTDEIARVLDQLLDDAGFAQRGTDPLREALVQIAARYGAIVTQSLNATADLHLKAFSELLGGQARPATAARVHVSFRPAAGAPIAVAGAASQPVKVPMYTRVAIQSGGSGEPPVFETMADLELVRAEVVSAQFVDEGHRRVAAVGAIFSEAGFAGDVRTSLAPVTYAVHIGQRAAFSVPGLQRVRVQIDVQDAGLRDPSSVLEWIVATPKGDVPLEVEQDTTGGLARSGEVVLVPPSPWTAASVNGIESLWLTLRLRHGPEAEPMAPAPVWRPPRLAALRIRSVAATGPQGVMAACHETMPLDISKGVFPFGERPRFGAVFQLLCPAFGEAGARVELIVRLTNPEGATAAPVPPVSRAGQPHVVWEIATTSGFQAITASDGTQSLTQDGSVIFTVPNDAAAVPIAGKTGTWLRARLASGHYGSMPATDGTAMVVMRAPAVKSVAVRSALERGPLPPEHLVSVGALQIDPNMHLPMDAFPSPDVSGPALYIGLGALGGAPDALDVLAKGCVISWHVRPRPTPLPIVYGESAPHHATLQWQMRSADGWRDITVHDDSVGLTRSGIVQLTLRDEPSQWPGNMLDPSARKLAWLRIVWPAQPTSPGMPQLPAGLTINSVAARHSQRLTNEIVGSSNGRAHQVFKALRTPIIGDVLLQVRETDDDWMTWSEVDTLAATHAESREFTLDRSTGEIRFGDGRFGRIPPPGANNIRLHQYTTGGGLSGNQPTKAIAQMRSAVPAVESVINLEPATGGLDVEDAAHVRAHASAWLRHRDRAVCADDFADLALKASPEVARAFCVAGRDLGVAPTEEVRELETQPGVVSTIVIPRSTDPCPQPSLDLLSRVKEYLDARRSPAGRLVMVGPTYTSISVRLQVIPTVGWSPDAVAGECKQRIARFLHPLTGNSDGCGWALGQRPHRSDLYGLLDTVDGVDFVRRLALFINVPTGMPIIVAAGTITVELVSDP